MQITIPDIITEIYILNRDGHLFLTFNPTLSLEIDPPEDNTLTAGFLSALQSFSLERFQDTLSEYIIGEYRFDIFSTPHLYYFAKSKKTLSSILLRKKQHMLQQIAIRFESNFKEKLNNFNGEVSEFRNFRKEIWHIFLRNNPLIAEYSFPLHNISDLPLTAPQESFELIDWLCNDIALALRKKISNDFLVYLPYEDEQNIKIKIIIWEHEIPVSIETEGIAKLLHQINLERWTLDDIYEYLELIDEELLLIGSPENLLCNGTLIQKKNLVHSVWYQLQRQNLVLCPLCGKKIVQDSAKTCESCNILLSNDPECIFQCDRCKKQLCLDCIYVCETCGKKNLCWECIFFDPEKNINQCYECFQKNHKNDFIELISENLLLLRKCAVNEYYMKNYQQALTFFKNLYDKLEIAKNQYIIEVDIMINIAYCYIKTQKFKEALTALKMIENNSKINQYPRLREIYCKALLYCYEFFSNPMNINPQVANIYSSLLQQTKEEISRLNSNSTEILQACIENLEKISSPIDTDFSLTSEPERYYDYRPPEKYHFKISDFKPRKEIFDIYSPFDMVNFVITSIGLKAQLSPLNNYLIHIKGRILYPETRLFEYNINAETDILEIIKCPNRYQPYFPLRFD